MHPFHIFVSAFNIVVGALFASLIWVCPLMPICISREHPTWAAFSVFGGYCANALAIFVSAVVVIMYLVGVSNGQARLVLQRHWLGVFNGLFVIVFWVLLFSISRLVYSFENPLLLNLNAHCL
jgi:hypothetical protein